MQDKKRKLAMNEWIDTTVISALDSTQLAVEMKQKIFNESEAVVRRFSDFGSGFLSALMWFNSIRDKRELPTAAQVSVFLANAFTSLKKIDEVTDED